MGIYDDYLFQSPLLEEDYYDDEYIETTPIYYNEEYDCFVDDYGNIYILDESWMSDLTRSLRGSRSNNNQSRVQRIPQDEINKHKLASATAILGHNLRMLRKAGVTSDQMHDMINGKTPAGLGNLELQQRLGNNACDYYNNIKRANSVLSSKK